MSAVIVRQGLETTTRGGGASGIGGRRNVGYQIS